MTKRTLAVVATGNENPGWNPEGMFPGGSHLVTLDPDVRYDSDNGWCLNTEQIIYLFTAWQEAAEQGGELRRWTQIDDTIVTAQSYDGKLILDWWEGDGDGWWTEACPLPVTFDLIVDPDPKPAVKPRRFRISFEVAVATWEEARNIAVTALGDREEGIRLEEVKP